MGNKPNKIPKTPELLTKHRQHPSQARVGACQKRCCTRAPLPQASPVGPLTGDDRIGSHLAGWYLA